MQGSEIQPTETGSQRLSRAVLRVGNFFACHWLAFLNGFWGLLVLGAFVPPLLMEMGFERAAEAGYTAYSFTCHQLPERSFFLFAPDGALTMYDKPELIAAGANPTNQLTMRQFVGTEQMGWKLGFSDRMVSMYGGAFLGGIIFSLLSRRRPMGPIPIWLLLLLVMPMALDGTTHMISDFTIGGDPTMPGFRDTNAWARPFFAGQPDPFFTTNHFGSLNSHLRLWSGLFFGVALMLYAYPLMALGAEEIDRDSAPYAGGYPTTLPRP